MTVDEEDWVLRWLRSRGKEPAYEKPHRSARRILQRALRGGEPISREIRETLADWLLASPASMLPEERDSFVSHLGKRR